MYQTFQACNEKDLSAEELDRYAPIILGWVGKNGWVLPYCHESKYQIGKVNYDYPFPFHYQYVFTVDGKVWVVNNGIYSLKDKQPKEKGSIESLPVDQNLRIGTSNSYYDLCQTTILGSPQNKPLCFYNGKKEHADMVLEYIRKNVHLGMRLVR